MTALYFQTEPSSSIRGSSSSWAAPSSLHSQPWDHRSRPPDPWEAPQNTTSPVPSSQTWRSAAAPGRSILFVYFNQNKYMCTDDIYVRDFVLAATGIDPFTPLSADKTGTSSVPVKCSSSRPGSPTGNTTNP